LLAFHLFQEYLSVHSRAAKRAAASPYPQPLAPDPGEALATIPMCPAY